MYRINLPALVALDVNADGSIDGATIHVAPHTRASVALDAPGALTADEAGELPREVYAPATRWPSPSWHVPPALIVAPDPAAA